jgi:adenylosuccinate lyase
VTDRTAEPSAALEALSPVDGRYADKCRELRALFSEAALIRHRVRVEAEWFLFLAEDLRLPELAALRRPVLDAAAGLAARAAPGEAQAVKGEEAQINHDVKAVEYYVRGRRNLHGAHAVVFEPVFRFGHPCAGYT